MKTKRKMVTNQPSIEVGWQSYLKMVLSVDAPEIQISECRLAFFAGAATLFYAIMKSLDPGSEPTEDDLVKLDNISNELDKFAKTFDEEVAKRKS
jgi:hypothetical protein